MPYGPDRSNGRPWCVLVLSENLSGPYIYSYISIMSVRIPPLLQKPRGSKKTSCRKQTKTEMKQGLVAEWPPLPTKKWKEEMLSCSHMLTLKQGVSRSCLDRSPVWSAEWKEIKQHISASLQLLGQSYWYCSSAEYRWGYWVYLVSEGEHIQAIYSLKKQASKIIWAWYIILQIFRPNVWPI